MPDSDEVEKSLKSLKHRHHGPSHRHNVPRRCIGCARQTSLLRTFPILYQPSVAICRDCVEKK